MTLPQFAPVLPRGDILAIATNNDGRTKEGVTFPSGPAQRALAEVVLFLWDVLIFCAIVILGCNLSLLKCLNACSGQLYAHLNFDAE
jgi:hypothetical protein